MNRRPYAESLRSVFIIQGGGVEFLGREGRGGVDFAAKMLTYGCFIVSPYTTKDRGCVGLPVT